MQKIPIHSIIEQLDSYYSKENFKNAKELINFWSQTAIKFEDRGGQLTLENELIGLVRRTGEQMEGLAAIDRALLIIDKGLVSDEIAIATTWLNCGTTYECFGYFDKAIPLYYKTREVYERILSPDDPRMAGLYNNMAYTYRELGDIDTATKATRRAIDIMLTNHDLHDAAVSYVNLAEIFEVKMLETKTHEVKMCEAGTHDANTCDAKMQGAENHEAQMPGLKTLDVNDRESKFQEESADDVDDLLLQIDNCLMKAYELLKDPRNIQDGNYAYSLKKCVSGYEHFGYDTIAQELSVRAQEIYAGIRAGKKVL